MENQQSIQFCGIQLRDFSSFMSLSARPISYISNLQLKSCGKTAQPLQKHQSTSDQLHAATFTYTDRKLRIGDPILRTTYVDTQFRNPPIPSETAHIIPMTPCDPSPSASCRSACKSQPQIEAAQHCQSACAFLAPRTGIPVERFVDRQTPGW